MTSRIGMIILLASLSKIALAIEMYNFNQYDDLYFEMKNKEITKLLDKYSFNKKNEIISLKLFYLKGEKDCEFNNPLNVKRKIVDSIKKQFMSKADLVFSSTSNTWLGLYRREKINKNTNLYIDDTNLLDISEIEITTNEKEIVLTEKMETQTNTTTYLLKKEKWSDGKYIIDRVTRTADLKNETIITKSNLYYQKIEGDIWMPSKVVINTKQYIENEQEENTERNIVEEFEFINFQVNKQKALTWYAKK